MLVLQSRRHVIVQLSPLVEDLRWSKICGDAFHELLFLILRRISGLILQQSTGLRFFYIL